MLREDFASSMNDLSSYDAMKTAHLFSAGDRVVFVSVTFRTK